MEGMEVLSRVRVKEKRRETVELCSFTKEHQPSRYRMKQQKKIKGKVKIKNPEKIILGNSDIAHTKHPGAIPSVTKPIVMTV